jgi:hypothetical protein
MHKMSKVYAFRFKVEGQGRFPIEMLRYDRCHPNSSMDCEHISFDPEWRSDPPRQVTLTKYGVSKEDLPSKERWETFGWQVVSIASGYIS